MRVLTLAIDSSTTLPHSHVDVRVKDDGAVSNVYRHSDSSLVTSFTIHTDKEIGRRESSGPSLTVRIP